MLELNCGRLEQMTTTVVSHCCVSVALVPGNTHAQPHHRRPRRDRADVESHSHDSRAPSGARQGLTQKIARKPSLDRTDKGGTALNFDLGFGFYRSSRKEDTEKTAKTMRLDSSSYTTTVRDRRQPSLWAPFPSTSFVLVYVFSWCILEVGGRVCYRRQDVMSSLT